MLQHCKSHIQTLYTISYILFSAVSKLLMMAYLIALLTTILTVANGATPFHCSDVQPSASGSHNTADLSQVTALRYCIIDNCTIMNVDNGEQLDIVYATESLLIVTPTHDHTSVVVAKRADDDFPCYHNYTANDSPIGELVGPLTLTSLIMIVSGYILIVHLLFKELRTLFGKLLMFYSLSIVSLCTDMIALFIMHHWIIVNSEIICYIAMVTFMITSTSIELFATSILTHLAYIMYRCYHLKSEISKKRSQFLFRCYLAYAFIALVLLFFVTITYDWRTGNGRFTLLPNGHCTFIDQYTYNTILLSDTFSVINKLVQIIMLVAYVVYLYRYCVNIGGTQTLNVATVQSRTFEDCHCYGRYHWSFIFDLGSSGILSRLCRHHWHERWCFFVYPTSDDYEHLPMHKKMFGLCKAYYYYSRD